MFKVLKQEMNPQKKPSKSQALLVGGGASMLLLVPALFLGVSSLTGVTYQGIVTNATTTISGKVVKAKPSLPHVKPPEPLKAIYMSQCVVGTPSFREDLVELVDETELNAIVIDIKDYTGKISFTTENPKLSHAVSNECGALDMPAFLKHLHEKDIYVIGRVTVFQDPYYTSIRPDLAVHRQSATTTPWKDYKGLSFIDVGAKEYWDYIIELSHEAYAIGFDELNYDYVRYPSDGNMKDTYFTHSNGNKKAEELEKFFRYLHAHMTDSELYPNERPMLSADLFGYTTVLTDDLGIGQQLERALPYFDYIAPMVYPSHYNSGFAGLKNPNSDPYKVIYTSMVEAVNRAKATETPVETLEGEKLFDDEIVPAYTNSAGEFIATSTKKVATGMYSKPPHSPLKLRPWLQDFDYGGDYGAIEVRAQIQATYDSGLTSWFLWAPSNRYTRGALLNTGAE